VELGIVYTGNFSGN